MNSAAEISALQTLCLSSLAAGEALRAGQPRAVVDTGAGVIVEVETDDELFVLLEIFFKGVYERRLRGPYTVVDVGMNIGMASLFFAAKPEVERVVGYELVRPTYEAALRNLALNPELSAKVTAHPYGLWTEDATFEIAYDKERRCSIGVTAPAVGSSRESVAVRRASTELAAVLESAQAPVVLKLDCEGAEYEILEDLAGGGLLSRFHAVLCEWHRKGPESLAALLDAAGFDVACEPSSISDTGLVYGVRRPEL